MASRAGRRPALAIPATLYDSLMARLDRSAPVKEVAQVGACIGREFSHELLAAAAGRPEPELRAALHQLLASGLIFRRGKPPERGLRFQARAGAGGGVPEPAEEPPPGAARRDRRHPGGAVP